MHTMTVKSIFHVSDDMSVSMHRIPSSSSTAGRPRSASALSAKYATQQGSAAAQGGPILPHWGSAVAREGSSSPHLGSVTPRRGSAVARLESTGLGSDSRHAAVADVSNRCAYLLMAFAAMIRMVESRLGVLWSGLTCVVLCCYVL